MSVTLVIPKPKEVKQVEATGFGARDSVGVEVIRNGKVIQVIKEQTNG
jgi:hypothetical protein